MLRGFICLCAAAQPRKLLVLQMKKMELVHGDKFNASSRRGANPGGFPMEKAACFKELPATAQTALPHPFAITYILKEI